MLRSSRTMVALLIAFSAIAVLAGSPAEPCPFAGNWTGHYEVFFPDGTLEDMGPIDLAISEHGVIQGRGVSLGPDGSIYAPFRTYGHVKNDGEFTVGFFFEAGGGGAATGWMTINDPELAAQWTLPGKDLYGFYTLKRVP